MVLPPCQLRHRCHAPRPQRARALGCRPPDHAELPWAEDVKAGVECQPRASESLGHGESQSKVGADRDPHSAEGAQDEAS